MHPNSFIKNGLVSPDFLFVAGSCTTLRIKINLGNFCCWKEFSEVQVFFSFFRSHKKELVGALKVRNLQPSSTKWRRNFEAVSDFISAKLFLILTLRNKEEPLGKI